MGRVLDAPLAEPISETVSQNIPQIVVEFGYRPSNWKNPGLSPSVGPIIDLGITSITYDVGNYIAEGHAPKRKRESVKHVDWPPEVMTAVRVLQRWADSDGVAKGFIKPGTFTDEV